MSYSIHTSLCVEEEESSEQQLDVGLHLQLSVIILFISPILFLLLGSIYLSVFASLTLFSFLFFSIKEFLTRVRVN